MFATYFCWSALIAQPAAACKPADSSLNGSVDMAVEALLGSVAFISAANAASASTDGSAYMAPPRMVPRCDELARESASPQRESWGKFHVHHMRCQLWNRSTILLRSYSRTGLLI